MVDDSKPGEGVMIRHLTTVATVIIIALTLAGSPTSLAAVVITEPIAGESAERTDEYLSATGSRHTASTNSPPVRMPGNTSLAVSTRVTIAPVNNRSPSPRLHVAHCVWGE